MLRYQEIKHLEYIKSKSLNKVKKEDSKNESFSSFDAISNKSIQFS